MTKSRANKIVLRLLIIFIAVSFIMGCFSACKKDDNKTQALSDGSVIKYSFDEGSGNQTLEKVSGDNYKVEYVFNEKNQDRLSKPASDPLWRNGVSGKALYMDGFSNKVINKDFEALNDQFALSAWVAPRVFENLWNYSDVSPARGNPRLTSVISQGDIEAGEGFSFGYARLGLWGFQLAVYDPDTLEEYVISFYDPINTLPYYEWSHIAVSYDCTKGQVSLYFNGKIAYEGIYPEYAGFKPIKSYESLIIGGYGNPVTEFSMDRQMVSGLLDEVVIYEHYLPLSAINKAYSEVSVSGHPTLDFSEIALDSSVYEGDRYRPQYHAMPPAVWMNEPHSPFYYNGYYHVFYQHNPSGPYWSQIRWGHIVSKDMIHWKYVKDAVAQTKGICPEGIWTGGAVIGPDGLPWLVITAGTNQTTWSGQNIAFAHAADPTDPYLTDWIVEDSVVITQPNDDSQGERDQFRDPFVWFDSGTYYMLISTSIPHAGGSGNMYTSKDMREWEYRGYVYECDINLYPEQGAHWECVVMLPITTKDGSKTKYILFDCPQYTVDGYTVECYYWIGTFNKATCRFEADDNKPRLFDLGRGIYTGQNGYCYLTDEQQKSGAVYEDGRTILYAIAQGKDAGTELNYFAGWAHNYAIPLELWLSDDGTDVRYAPISETESLRKDTLYQSTRTMTASEVNAEISALRGDLLEINMQVTLNPTADEYDGGIMVRYNPNGMGLTVEYTKMVFSNLGIYVDRQNSTLYTHITKSNSHIYGIIPTTHDVKILMDRSMLEIYVDNKISFTTRMYPKYADSDYLKFFDNNSGIKINSLTIYRMGSAYSDSVTPAYYGNTGNMWGGAI